MSKLTSVYRNGVKYLTYCRHQLSTDISYPVYKVREGEQESYKRKRLVYQSRKRGMTENGILLSTFADLYLDTLDSNQLDQYDKLINEPSDDWSLYYWITEAETPPIEYQNSILQKLQEHAKKMSTNTGNQPPLK